MQANPLAGKTADPAMPVNVPRLVTAYFVGKPDPGIASQRIAFGTSGHRGSAFNGIAFGGIKVIAESGWFAARSSGTEEIYKIYAESFLNEGHLRQIQQDAQGALAHVFEAAKVRSPA